MTERLYANEAATAAINKLKCLDVRLGLYQVMVDFHEAMTAFDGEEWSHRIVERVEAAYERRLLEVQ